MPIPLFSLNESSTDDAGYVVHEIVLGLEKVGYKVGRVTTANLTGVNAQSNYHVRGGDSTWQVAVGNNMVYFIYRKQLNQIEVNVVKWIGEIENGYSQSWKMELGIMDIAGKAVQFISKNLK